METPPNSCNTSPKLKTTTRRTFLQHCSLPAYAALSGMGVLMLPPAKTLAQEIPVSAQTAIPVTEPVTPTISPKDQFKHAAQLLTGHKQLNDSLLEKALATLQLDDPQFENMLAKLYQLLLTEEIADAQAFMQSKNMAKEHDALTCAKQITCALYTGRVGQGSKAQLISYEHALMYQPTQDITVIPSYSRGGRDYWIHPPI